MYIFDTPDFREAVRWFRENKASFFSYLCVCISDNSSKGRKLFKYIHKNMERIDNITGDDICFLATVKNRGKRMSIPSRIYDEEAEFFDDMDRHEAGIMQEKMSNRIFNDVISYCDWQRINLPALLFTPLHNPFSTFGCVVKSAADLNLAFELINVFTMYKQDLRKIDEVYNKMKENRIREKALTEQKELKDYLSTASLDEQVDKLIKIIRANTEANDSFISLLKNNPSKYYPKAMGEFVTLRELPEAIEVTRQIRTIIKARKRLDALKELLSADKIIPRHTQLNEAEIHHLDWNRQDKKNNL